MNYILHMSKISAGMFTSIIEANMNFAMPLPSETS